MISSMLRAALYARYSTDLQSDRSIEDQLALCRAYAEKNGLEVVATFIDRAVSGASIHGRHGLQRLMGEARASTFDVVLAETLSRLGRDEGDRATIRKLLTFADVRIMTTVDGLVNRLTDGIKAVIDAQQLEDNKAQIRRGLSGVVRDGRHAGGRAYGYRPVKGEPGRLEIVEPEAETVRRIFAEFAAGSSPREIAAGLNADRIPAPRKATWRASVISGNVARGHSLIANELYAGVIVWNRVRMVKDPDTGRRVIRTNSPAEWQRSPAPHLRIVAPELWEAVQARRRKRSQTVTAMRRTPRRMLSGLLKCGACGGGMSITGTDRKGPRIVCSAYHEGRACTHGRKYYVAEIEGRVVGALKGRLGSRAALALYVKRYNEERVRLNGEASGRRAKLERIAAEAKRALDRAVENLIRGRISESEADAVLPGLREEHARAATELAALAEPPKTVTLHPGAVDAFLTDLDRLADVIADHTAEGRLQAATALRKLIDMVTVLPALAGTPPELRVAGHLASLTGIPAFPQGRILSAGLLVAEERYSETRRQYPFEFAA